MTVMMPRVTATIALALLSPCATAQKPIGDAEFDKLHAELQPVPGKWLQIPWMTGLLDARAKAVKEKKPLFMWAMNGHPLGCT